MQHDLKYLNEEKTRHGRRVLYVRFRGKRIRLKHPLSSPDFIVEYQIALQNLSALKTSISAEAPSSPPAKEASKKQNGTFGWLVLKYLNESPAYKTMRPNGQLRRRRILEDICVKHGDKPMLIPKDRIVAGLTARAELPGAANEWLKSIKSLYTWAQSVGVIAENPASGVSKLKTSEEGFYTWTLEDLASYTKRHTFGTMAYLTCILLLFTGLRRSDAIALGKQHIKNETIRFRTGKTGSELITKISWPLAEAISAMPQTSELTFLLNGNGRPFASGAAFGNWFKDRCTEAGLPHCTAHGLRKAGATIAAENGAPEVELEAMFGWANNRQSGTYTRSARSLVLATAGFDRVANALVSSGVLKKSSPVLCVAPKTAL